MLEFAWWVDAAFGESEDPHIDTVATLDRETGPSLCCDVRSSLANWALRNGSYRHGGPNRWSGRSWR